MSRGSNIVVATTRPAIAEYLSNISKSVSDILKKDSLDSSNNYSYLLIKKGIMHADVVTAGKGNEKTGVERNFLYYLSVHEMEKLQSIEGDKFFSTTHQSNISVPDEFFEFLGIPKIKRREGKQLTQHEHPIINNYAKVYLVNDTMGYFDISYTKEVFNHLGKSPDWDYRELKVELNSGDFTPIQLSHAVHGIGTKEDVVFHKLRHSIFRGDNIIMLIRKVGIITHLYIMLEKNPRFFTIIGKSSSSWENYLNQNNKKQLFDLIKSETISTENEKSKTRKYQNHWRQMLAEEMMNYTPTDNEVFCPLTYVSANFNKAGALFVASHIKEYVNCTMDEAFDINNGILMTANADALFDKHLITIEDDGTIIFSFLLENEYKLRQEIKLTEKVFKSILNPDRCKYLEYHREVFRKEEEKRRLGQS